MPAVITFFRDKVSLFNTGREQGLSSSSPSPSSEARKCRFVRMDRLTGARRRERGQECGPKRKKKKHAVFNLVLTGLGWLQFKDSVEGEGKKKEKEREKIHLKTEDTHVWNTVLGLTDFC